MPQCNLGVARLAAGNIILARLEIVGLEVMKEASLVTSDLWPDKGMD